ncbi:MAG TPA: serine/threonine-protein kinase [Pseudonocardiaceae bacterium]|nr:serine/threonine-protein kinase [Pseudonocardiaceae bacterium]
MGDEDRLIAGRYRLVERIGGGAMGIVWRAQDELLKRTVAVKQFLPQAGLAGAALDEARERVRREARITARLQHNCAVTVFDEVEDGGVPFLVMEYVPSKSLGAVLAQNGPLEPIEVARIGARLASALAAAHRVGIVHRDVKPANVLVADDGSVKLVDFGISRAVGDVVLTATGLVSGTPAYLAPELAGGEDPSPGSDTFSLGATLYAAVEGQPPFGLHDNALAALHAVATGRVRPPQQAGPLTAVLSGLLRIDPTERISIEAAESAFTAIAGGASAADSGSLMASLSRLSTAKPSTVDHTLTVPVRRSRPSRTAVILALGTLVVIGGALVGAILLSSNNQHANAASGTGAASTSTTGQPGSSSAAPTSDVRKFLVGYYGLFPNHVDQAFQLLSPHYQQTGSGGLAAFRGFYQTIASVQVRKVTVTGKHSATATLAFSKRAGGVSVETYKFTLVSRNGGLLIDNAQRVTDT